MVSSTSPATVRAKAGAIFRVTSGNFLEQFDFFLFGFYATYIAHTFFPASSEFASLMMTFAVFGAGFLMRPIGAIVLGAYIDKVGRRKGLIVTLSIMAAGTFLIVLIPSYQSIGLWAPLLVLTGRLLQGFSAGAELGGVSVYLAEIATPGRKGFYTSWQSGSQQVAIMVAAAMGFALNALMEESAIREWGWRIPFLFGCLIVPFIFFLRRKLEETEAFNARRHHLAMRQVFKTLLTNWQVVVAGMLMVAMTTTLLSSMGSRVVLPGSGVLMNNGVMWFDPRPGQANSIGPGKRPLTNMCPVIVREGGRPVLAAGASGGRRIMAAVLQTVACITDIGMTPDAAAHHPRIDVSDPETVSVDMRMPEDVVAALRRSGPTEVVEHGAVPVNFACPNLIVQYPDGTRTGISDAASPWSAAVAQ